MAPVARSNEMINHAYLFQWTSIRVMPGHVAVMTLLYRIACAKRGVVMCTV